MKKQSITKIISGLILLAFVMSFFQFASPVQADVLNDDLTINMKELFNNPNQINKKSAYRFSLKVAKSGILQNVIGCSGIVNKVAKWMATLTLSSTNQAKILQAQKDKLKEQYKATCTAVVAAGESGLGSVIGVNDLVTAFGTTMQEFGTKMFSGDKKNAEDACKKSVEASVDKLTEEQIKANEQAEANRIKEQCFDGIAITLARNQLTSMTHSAINWVNSGYGGNPFFVQNMTNFTRNLENNVLDTGIDILLAPKNQSPYASDFAKSKIISRSIEQSSAGFLGNLQSTLSSFITDPNSYYTIDQFGKAEDTRTAVEIARDANDTFADDFSTGGWNAWLALTQQDQNNPLGYTMLANQYLEDMQEEKVTNKKDELAQNNGFLSQKKCVLWDVRDADGDLEYEMTIDDSLDIDNPIYGTALKTTTNPDENDTCDENGWKVITPGSIIRDKTTSYLNSPERQLELAKTINDSLNALFSILISKLEESGLSGLSDAAVSTDWTDDTNNLDSSSSTYTSSDGSSTYDNNGAYDSFNLTKDLGNTYIHDTPTYLGEWDAKKNIAYQKKGGDSKLYSNLAPEEVYNNRGEAISVTNSYYTVSVAGKTPIIDEGYNGWEVGDRAFWDGSKWQNWKKGQANPIKERGVVQIQQDYIVAAKEILGVLPNVMTNLGELDYCIPGPNPSYKTNSTDNQSAYQDWVGSLYVGTKDNDENRYYYSVDHPGDRTYDNLANMYSDNPNVWATILGVNDIHYITSQLFSVNSGIYSGMQYLLQNFNYHNYYSKGRWFSGAKQEGKDTDWHGKIKDTTQNYVNNSLFQNFYEVFDKMMDKLYFKNMTSEYLEYENKSIDTENDKNPGYIEMAESGLSLTENMKYYNDDIATATAEYTDAIATAKANIAKLEPIKAEVSGIIKAAQDRRNKKMIEILNTENKKTVKPADLDKNGTVTEAEYLKYYASCLDEEDIQFYDPDEIMATKSLDEERCDDKIDNDLDGLVDMNDPDCNKNHNCSRGTSYTPVQTQTSPSSKKCSDITNAQECVGTKEYYLIGGKRGAVEYQCVWNNNR